MELNQNISLNFLPLKEQKFHFTVFRKQYNGEKINNEGIYVERLPIKIDNGTEYQKYLISLEKLEGFENFYCNQNHNRILNLHFLWELLCSQRDKNYTLIRGHRFSRKLYYILNEDEIGKQTIFLSPFYLEQKNEYGFLIDYKFLKEDDIKFNRIVQQKSLSLDKNGRSNRFYYSDKLNILNNFIASKLSSIFPLQNFESNEIHISNSLREVNNFLLQPKTYVFKNQREDNSQFNGIKKYGVQRNINDKIEFLFVFEDKYKEFANKIFMGLSGKFSPGTFSGLEQMFGIEISKSNVKQIKLIDESIDSIKNALNEIDSIKKQSNKRLLVIYLEQNYDHEISASKSPYYILKYGLLEKDIPLQVISYENNSAHDSLKWSISNIGLQIFAKLGGIPWSVKPTNNNCLIVGIGSSHKYNKDGNVEKYLAYSVCLDSTGQYQKISVLADNIHEIDYLQNLKDSIEKLLKEFNSYSKVVLHLPFKIKRNEINNIKEQLNQHNNIEFKVIKINDRNKYFGFSNHNTKIPYESTCVKIANREYIIWFEGLQYGKENVIKQPSNPVLIEFLDDSDPHNDVSYVQDIINLTGANWRGFNAKQLPVSLFYAELVAKYIKAFKEFDAYELEKLSNVLPWFL